MFASLRWNFSVASQRESNEKLPIDVSPPSVVCGLVVKWYDDGGSPISRLQTRKRFDVKLVSFQIN